MADPITEAAVAAEQTPAPAGEGAQQQELSLREELEASFDAAEQQQEQQPADGASTAPPAGRARDEQGRFTSAPPIDAKQRIADDAKARGLPAIPPAPQPPPHMREVPPAEAKPPGSWRPEVREKWQRLDPDVRGEVVRREREFQAHLMQTAHQRQFVDAFERTVAPYQLFIRQEQSTPLQAVENLMQTAALLRTGNQQQRVAAISSIIKNWCNGPGDLEALDRSLAGVQQQQPQQQMQPQQFRDPRVDQMLYMQAQNNAAAQAQMTSELDAGIAYFAQQPGTEFFEDVRPIMADLIEMAGRRGEVMPMADAYRHACQMHPGVAKILNQRAAGRPAALSQAALRARRAARSVTGDSALHEGAPTPKDDSVRSALEAAFEAHEGR